MTYIMESSDETRRLLAQEVAASSRSWLVATGLRAGHAALDLGCGPGLIAEEMVGIVGVEGRVVGLDSNPDRIREAVGRTSGRQNLKFVCSDVRKSGLPDSSFDYVWSQFLFEYLPDLERVLSELRRVARSGAKVVVADIDGAGLLNWPFPEALRVGTQKFLDALAPTGFDAFVGRKLYNLFRRAGLRDVRVHLAPHFVAAGAVDERMLQDWVTRFRALESIAAPALGGLAEYRRFCDAYLGLLKDEDTLKYSVLLITEGVNP